MEQKNKKLLRIIKLTSGLPNKFGNISEDKTLIQMLQKLYRHSSINTTILYQSNFINTDSDDVLDSVINFYLKYYRRVYMNTLLLLFILNYKAKQ